MKRTNPTRRDLLGSGAALGTALFAGCLGGDENGTDGTTDSSTSDPNTTAVASTDESSGTSDTGGSYTVSIEPMGPVEFDEPPERWTALLPTLADMGFALGGGQTLGIQNHARFANEAFESLPGVEFDADAIVELVGDGVPKELVYELNADAHLLDPNLLVNWYGWDRSDIEEVRTEIGPFFGNFSRKHSSEWHDGYRYYELYEMFELVADVFRARPRYEAFVDLHEEMLDTIDERIPPADQRPTALLVYPAGQEGDEFYPFRFDDGGISTKQWRELRLQDALAGTDIEHFSGTNNSTIDLEAMLEVDPEVLLVRNYGGASESEFREAVVEPLQDDPVASEVRAVQDGAVYPAGYLDQGPIINFYHTEQAALNIYPDAFEGATLFDRERVADIVTGDF